MIQLTLQLLVDWIESISGEVVKSKQICYQSIQEVVNITLGVFPVFIHQPGNTVTKSYESWTFHIHCLKNACPVFQLD